MGFCGIAVPEHKAVETVPVNLLVRIPVFILSLSHDFIKNSSVIH